MCTNYLNSLYMEENYIDKINTIAYTIILSLKSHINTDNIRYIWDFLKDDFKKQINTKHINSYIDRKIEKQKNMIAFSIKNFFSLTYHISDLPFRNIYPNNKSNGLLEYLKTALIKYHFIYNHICFHGDGFVFYKDFHNIRKQICFPVSDNTDNIIGTLRIGN